MVSFFALWTEATGDPLFLRRAPTNRMERVAIRRAGHILADRSKSRMKLIARGRPDRKPASARAVNVMSKR